MLPFGKPADTIVHESEPFNAEPPPAALAGRSLTELDRFYVRCHGPVPEIDPAAWRLGVDGLVERPLELTLEDLRGGRFAAAEVTATLQCAGNRRAGLMAVREIPGEAPWGPCATGTAVWRGVRLADVLAAAGARPDAGHVALLAPDHSPEASPPQPYGISIAHPKARAPEVLLAWSMNGAALPAAHGGPVRAVVPGYVGARSVKWVAGVQVRADPYDGHFQATAYRLLAPDEEPGPGVGIPLGEVALNTATLSPVDGARVPAGIVEATGYALAGGGRSVRRVEASIDGGATWRRAELLEDLGRWAWRMWRIALALEPGRHEILVRAWDSAAATQPEDPASVWNPKGYANTAWARTRVVAG